MGDRVNLGLRTSDGNTIFLYLHWGGYDRHSILARAIKTAMTRDGDESYFTRIFVSQIIGVDWNRETGAGMLINKLPSSGDGYDVLIYDYRTKTIGFYEEVWDDAGGFVKHTDVEYDRDDYLMEHMAFGEVNA